MTSNLRQRGNVENAILTFAIATGFFGLVSAQTGLDFGIIPCFYFLLIFYIGRQCGSEELQVKTVFSMVSPIIAMYAAQTAGVAAVSLVGRFVPGVGNVAIGVAYFYATQKIGWFAYHYFSSEEVSNG